MAQAIYHSFGNDSILTFFIFMEPPIPVQTAVMYIFLTELYSTVRERASSDELMTSIEQGGAILKGKKMPSRRFKIEDPDVPEIRRHLGLTQKKFAILLGISLAILRNWVLIQVLGTV